MAARAKAPVIKPGIFFSHNMPEVRKQTKQTSSEFSKFLGLLKRVSQTLIAFKISNAAIRSVGLLAREVERAGEIFERAEVQLKVFLDSAVLAKDELNFLTFESTRLAGGIEDLINASTALATFNLDSRRFLELTADVAQATGRAVGDVAVAIGRIHAGDPRTKQFLVTRRGDISEFNRVLKETGDRALAVEAAFKHLRGTSAELEGSYGRLKENLSDILFIGAKIAGEPIFDRAKKALSELVELLRDEVFDESGKRKRGFFDELADTIDNSLTEGKELLGILKEIVDVKDLLTGLDTFGDGKSDGATSFLSLNLRAMLETIKAMEDLPKEAYWLSTPPDVAKENIKAWFVRFGLDKETVDRVDREVNPKVKEIFEKREHEIADALRASRLKIAKALKEQAEFDSLIEIGGIFNRKAFRFKVLNERKFSLFESPEDAEIIEDYTRQITRELERQDQLREDALTIERLRKMEAEGIVTGKP